MELDSGKILWDSKSDAMGRSAASFMRWRRAKYFRWHLDPVLLAKYMKDEFPQITKPGKITPVLYGEDR